MLGDPDADYINANYIDVSASPATSADLALPTPGSPSRRGRNLPGIRGHSDSWVLSAPTSCIGPGSSEQGRTEWAAVTGKVPADFRVGLRDGGFSEAE